MHHQSTINWHKPIPTFNNSQEIKFQNKIWKLNIEIVCLSLYIAHSCDNKWSGWALWCRERRWALKHKLAFILFCFCHSTPSLLLWVVQYWIEFTESSCTWLLAVIFHFIYFFFDGHFSFTIGNEIWAVVSASLSLDTTWRHVTATPLPKVRPLVW